MARTTRSGHRNILARPIRKLRANGKAFLPSPEAIRSLVSPSFCGNLHDLLLNRPRLLCSALSSSLSLPLLHLFLLFSFSSNFNGASLTVPSRAYMYTDLLGSFLLIFFFFFYSRQLFPGCTYVTVVHMVLLLCAIYRATSSAQRLQIPIQLGRLIARVEELPNAPDCDPCSSASVL